MSTCLPPARVQPVRCRWWGAVVKRVTVAARARDQVEHGDQSARAEYLIVSDQLRQLGQRNPAHDRSFFRVTRFTDLFKITPQEEVNWSIHHPGMG
jgi:hypothetical protein